MKPFQLHFYSQTNHLTCNTAGQHEQISQFETKNPCRKKLKRPWAKAEEEHQNDHHTCVEPTVQTCVEPTVLVKGNPVLLASDVIQDRKKHIFSRLGVMYRRTKKFAESSGHNAALNSKDEIKSLITNVAQVSTCISGSVSDGVY